MRYTRIHPYTTDREQTGGEAGSQARTGPTGEKNIYLLPTRDCHIGSETLKLTRTVCATAVIFLSFLYVNLSNDIVLSECEDLIGWCVRVIDCWEELWVFCEELVVPINDGT